MIKERRIACAGYATRRLSVRGHEQLVFCLHGFSDSADTWRPLMAQLALLGHPVVAVDLPGFGCADWPPAGHPLIPELERFAAEAIVAASQNGRRPLVVGNSLGALIALRLAARGNPPIGGVAALSPAGFGFSAALLYLSPFVPLLAAMGRRTPVPTALLRMSVTIAYRQSLGRRQFSKEAVSRYVSHLGSRSQFFDRLDAGRRLALEMEALELEWLDSIDCPVTLIWGDRDRLTPVVAGARLLERLPTADLTVLRGCGHCPQLEAPAEVAGLLDDFSRLAELRGVDKRGGE